MWAWGQSLNWGAYSTRGDPKLTMVTFGGTGIFSSGVTCCCSINLFLQYLAPSGIPHMTWEYAFLLWISLWLVAISWQWVLSVAILPTEVWVVVAPWHRHHAHQIPAFWEDSVLPLHCCRGLGECFVGCLVPSVPQKFCWGRCVVLSCSMAMYGLVPSISHFMRIVLMVCMCHSMNPLPLG